MRFAASVAAVLVVATSLGACGVPDTDRALPRARYEAETPGDVMVAGDAAFADVIAAFPAQAGCLTDVDVVAAWGLGEEAGLYEPGRITVEVPATRRNIRAVFIHEYGHHLDHVCADEAIRSRFMEANGHPAGTDWFRPDASWGRRPVEQFAEAVTAVVGGSPLHSEVRLSSEAVRVVGEWAVGG